MKKLIITESSEKRLIQSLLQEEMGGWSDKVSLVKKFLDGNFLKATNSVIGDNGRPKLNDIVIWVDKFKQPKQYMSDKDLFYLLQDEFKNIIPPDDEDGKIHTTRDNFLKQCLKDWYYGKISKNGNLSLYEAFNSSQVGRNKGNYHRGDASHWNINNRDYRTQLQQRMSDLAPTKYAEDNTEDGINVIHSDINFLVDNFFKKKSHCPSKDMLINDMNGSYSDTSPDLYYLLQKILCSRAACKWCFICHNLASNITPRLTEVKKLASSFPNELFKTKEERDLYLPFYIPMFKEHVTPFLLKNKELKAEIDSAQEMTPELNVKIEEYLNTVYDYVEPIMFDKNNNFDEFEDF